MATPRTLLAALMCTVAGALVLAPSAGATFHLVKISEVGATAEASNDSYVELQMYSSGQNLLTGHSVTIWDEDGLAPPMAQPGPIETVLLSGPNPPNSQNQRTVLLGDTGVTGRDYTVELTPYFDPGVTLNLIDAGAICFDVIDCVSWGGSSFTGAQHLPDDTTPFDGAIASLLGVTAHHRTLARGCATALDPADDTNNAAADFTTATPSPRPNSVTPTEVPCATPTPTAKPPAKKRKCRKRKAKKGDAGAARRKCKRKKK